MSTNEYIANLDDAKTTYVYDNPAAAYDLDLRARRERAFDRMIREIQDEAYEEGQTEAHIEMGEY